MRQALLRSLLVVLALGCASFGVAADQGQARAWGKYLHYLGNGLFSTNAMQAPGGLNNVIALASGLQHAAALRADGRVVGFGEWSWGLTNVPAGLTNAIMISAGDYHTLALTRTRQVLAWGASYNNQCLVPPEATNIVAVAAGGFHSLALRADGQVLGWGDNRYGQCTVPAGLTNAIALGAGTWHSLALLENGRVVAWGAGSSGQLNVPPSLTNAVALAARASYSLALKSDGTVVGWGFNDAGQITIPASVKSAVAVAAGERHALALLRSGHVVAWGGNSGGQLVVPVEVTNATAVSAGSLHSAAALGSLPPLPAQPQPGLMVRSGRRVLLTAGVPGSQPMSYQWRRAGMPVAGATGAVLALNRAQPADAGGYSVVASNAAGLVTNFVAQLEVWVPEMASARFLFRDDSTVGNWEGVYGTQASAILGHATNDAAGALTLASGQSFPFQTNTPDARALERVDSLVPTNRYFGCVFGTDFVELRCALPLRETNQLALYLVEPGGGRSVSVDLYDQGTGDLLDRRGLGSLTNGTYLAWEIAGPVRVRVNRVAGANALLSGVFLGRSIGQRPALRAGPASLTVTGGARAILAGSANGDPPLAFQWRRNGQPLTNSAVVSGAKSPILTVNSVTAAEAGSYTLTVSNFHGAVTSSPASLSLAGAGQPPIITSPPQSASVPVGAPHTFSVTASGSAPLSYQWRFSGANLAAGTQSTLTLAGVQLGQAGGYTVVVTNGYGAVTSAVATLTVTNPGVKPTITSQPVSRTNVVGDTVSFSVTASGTAPLAYQWRFNGVNLTSATQSILTRPMVQHSQAGAYTVVVTNGYGAVTSAIATLTVTNPGVAPIITSQPASRTNAVGDTANFSVTASGTAPLSYQWRFNGANIAASTQSALALAAVQLNQAGAYSVMVSNGYGAVTSAVATLTVTNPGVAPIITTQPASLTNTVGDTASFSVIATGTAPLAYQWWFNGVNLTSATQSVLTRSMVQHRQAGVYSVVVTNGYGAVTSAIATLTVTNPGVAPTITSQSASQTNAVGETASFSVTASGTAPLSYQWQFNGSDIAASTQSTLTLAAVQLDQAGSYTVAVTNGYGAVTSAIATLTVTNPGVAPTITSQPVSRTNTVGDTVSFFVTASGTALLAYQWQFNGEALAGATESELSLTGVAFAQAGDYCVVVTNGYGAMTSEVATLTLFGWMMLDGESEPAGSNRQPQPEDDFLTFPDPGSQAIQPGELLANDSDPDNDVLEVIAVGPSTQRGGTVRLEGGEIIYQPPAGRPLWDAFNYVVQDPAQASASATVTLQMSADSNGSHLTPTVAAEAAGVRLSGSGVPGRTYLIQTADSLAGPWLNVSTNRANTDGSFEWTDSTTGAGVLRFYRTALP